MAARALQLRSEALARPSPALVGRARPLPRCFTPITSFHLRRLGELEQLVGARYLGWGRALEGAFFVDVLEDGIPVEDLESDGSGTGIERFTGDSLHGAIGAALRAARGRP